MSKCGWLVKCLVVLFAYSSVAAYAVSETGFGLVAKNLMDPVNYVNSFVQAACFIIGGSFVFASIIKYFEHRRSPLMVPISTVVALFVAGAVLILLPFLPYLTNVMN